jgi:hypothetical protein
MTEQDRRRWPDWAEQERAGDLAWIQENLHIFWPAAQLSHETVGRGAIVVDITLRPTGGGHPFGYLDQPAIEQGMPEDTQRFVREYGPSCRAEGEASRVEPGQEEVQSEATLEPPDIETLMAWEAEGGCEAACPDHCWVEPDGTCPHGKPSWLIVIGLI